MGQDQSTIGEKQTGCINCLVETDKQQVTWKKFLKDECFDLQGKCQWVGVVLKQLKRIKKSPIHKYFREIKDIDSEFMDHDGERRTHSYSNSIQSAYNQETFQFGNQPKIIVIPPKVIEVEDDQIPDRKSNKQTQSILKLMRNSDLLEEDIYVATQQIKGNKSFASTSSTPSFAFHEKMYLQNQIEVDPQIQELILGQISYFIRITNTIQKHLTQNDHQLNLVLTLFQATMFKYYGLGEAEDLETFQFELQQFCRVLEYCIELYYDIKTIKKMSGKFSQLLVEENLLNFIVSQVLGEERIYNIFYKQIAAAQDEKIQQIRKSIKALRLITPEQCKIQLKYRLDQTTYDSFFKMKYDGQQPYELAIKELQKVRNSYSSCSKLKIIIKMSQLIIKSIKTFYRKYNNQPDLLLEADDIMPIQTYILIKSQLHDISVHIYIIEKLATNKLLQGTAGYYLYTLNSAAQYLEKLEKNYKAGVVIKNDILYPQSYD